MKRAIPMPKGFKNKKRLISARNINEKTASVQADMLQKRCFPAWQKILCRRFSTKVKNGAVKQGGFWLKSPSLHHSQRCTAVCMPQA